jgi:rhomboid family GlyGly-CTERM serine protease
MGDSGSVSRLRGILKSLNCDGRRGLMLTAACLLVLLPALGGDPARRLLRYDRAGLLQGQWWRLVTGHLVHLDLRHALLNSAGLVLVWALFARDYAPKAWTAIVLAAIASIDAGLWLADSTVQWYVGSSGVLHGVMAAGALAHLRRGERDGGVLAALLLLKLAWEHWVGALPFAGADAVVVDAHLYGVLGGGAAGAFLRPRAAPL